MCFVLWLFPDLKSRRNLSFSEDSDLSCDDVLERSSQRSKADVSRMDKYIYIHIYTHTQDLYVSVIFSLIHPAVEASFFFLFGLLKCTIQSIS